MVDWGPGHAKLPSRMWGFVDLSGLRRNSRIAIGGTNDLQPGVHAVAECSKNVARVSKIRSDLMTEIELEVGGWAGAEQFVAKIVFYLVPVEAFVAPATVVPDIGGRKNSYLWLKPRHSWRDMFRSWLHEAHSNRELSESEGPTDADEELSVASDEPDEVEDTDDSDSDAKLEAELESELDNN